MKKILFLILFGCISGIALAQYVSSTIIQNQILKDKAIINSCQEAINVANADLQSILNDIQANVVVANAPEVQNIRKSKSGNGI